MTLEPHAGDRDAVPLLRLTATTDEALAERWRDALLDAGVDAHVQIEDVRDAMPGAQAIHPWHVPGVPFAFSVYVPKDERDRAAAVLIDEGWDGRHGTRQPPMERGLVIGGAIAAVLVAAAVTVVRLARG